MLKSIFVAEIIDLLRSVNAIITDSHFVFTSGKHGDVYINKDALYPHTTITAQVCQILAKKCAHLDIETVVAPALGGIILSQWLAYYLSQEKKKEIYGVYAEKGPDKTFLFTRGYDKFVKGKKILVVEDLSTTGGSVKKVVDVVRANGGQVVGVCVMVNRNPREVNNAFFGAELIAGAEFEVGAWEADDCPLCKKKIPINTAVGHGKKYLESLNKKSPAKL